MIYLDYSANTPVDPRVLEVYCRTEQNFIGNPNSTHCAGQAARQEMDRVTGLIAAQLGVLPEEIIYTSGATEANNLALKGTARAARHVGRHIISTPLEHSSVGATLTALQQQGYEIDLLNIGRDGRIDLEQLEELLRKDTMSFTAHKFYGPNGIGVLYKRKGLVIEPQMNGGASTTIYRSGTPTLGLAAALQAALALALDEQPQRCAHVQALHDALCAELQKRPGVRINSPAGAVPHIVNVSVEGIKAGVFQQALSGQGVCVSVKSACSTDGTPSKAVFAVSRDRKNALSSWRISLSHLTTEEELNGVLAAFDRCLKDLQKEK